MKRYFCTAAAGLLLALAGTGTATASVLPGLGQSGTQLTSFGDQTVGDQTNDAGVTQEQGNGNVNVSPAVAVFGDAETTNSQGNGNTATAEVDQGNTVDQSQSSEQNQSIGRRGTCCDGQSQAGRQESNGGDQSVGTQVNDAQVEQSQGNGNVNVSPAIAVFGDAETTNSQGNGNRADASVTQSNEANQSQSATQNQRVDGDGPCCKPARPRCDRSKPCGLTSWDEKDRCCAQGRSQAGEQHASFGDQTVREQRNDARVTQKQGNGNVNVSPAIGLGGGKGEACRSACSKSWKASNATATNHQGNGNRAAADVGQSNEAEQSQASSQHRSVVDTCKGLVHR